MHIHTINHTCTLSGDSDDANYSALRALEQLSCVYYWHLLMIIGITRSIGDARFWNWFFQFRLVSSVTGIQKFRSLSLYLSLGRMVWLGFLMIICRSFVGAISED